MARGDDGKDEAAAGSHAPRGSGALDVPGEGAADELGLEDLLPLAIPDAKRRGVGRPRGARNIRTEKTAQIAIGRYGDPLIASIALGNMKLDDFVTWLRKVASDCGMRVGKDVGVFDLLRFQEECRRNAMPYVHAKRATTDEKGDTVTPVLAIGRYEQTDVHVHGGGARSIEDAIDITPNQGVSDGEAEKSHAAKSHDEGKADE